jgi:hypothetical protein
MTTTPSIIVPGTAAPVVGTIIIPGGNPRADVANVVADHAAMVAAMPYYPGADTPGAVLTHAGNYIVPTTQTGMATCPVCTDVRPVTKFPTGPAAIDGTVPRITRHCRDCRDAMRDARKLGMADPAAYAYAQRHPETVTTTDRMSDRWDTHTPGAVPPNAMASAAATIVAMPDSMFGGNGA